MIKTSTKFEKLTKNDESSERDQTKISDAMSQ